MHERIRAWLAEIWPATAVDRLSRAERYAVVRMLPRLLVGGGPRLDGEPGTAAAVMAALLGAPVRLRARVRRVPIRPDERSRLGAANCQLGRTWALGAAATVTGTHWTVVVGPLSSDRERVLMAREWVVTDGTGRLCPHPRLAALADALLPASVSYEWAIRRRRGARWVLGGAALGKATVVRAAPPRR